MVKSLIAPPEFLTFPIEKLLAAIAFTFIVSLYVGLTLNELENVTFVKISGA